MTREYFGETLAAMMERKPFRVFTIELHGGKRLEIDGPHAVVWREASAIFLAPGLVPIYFDNESVSQIIDAPAHAAGGGGESIAG